MHLLTCVLVVYVLRATHSFVRAIVGVGTVLILVLLRGYYKAGGYFAAPSKWWTRIAKGPQ